VPDADLEALGLLPQDQADLRRHAGLLHDDDRARVADLAARLSARVGDLAFPWPRLFADARDEPGRPMGLLPLLALVAWADAGRRFPASRGRAPVDTARGRRVRGPQVAVPRRTYGEFGLHTQGWLVGVWSGAYFWPGRLAFNLMRVEGSPHEHWVIDTHIPEAGPLTPAAVDESFTRAEALFARHFADHPAAELHCHSWLLDPYLAEVLPADSNLVRFQQRWELYGEPQPGDDDAVFFVFRRRDLRAADLRLLPRETSLQRAVLDRVGSERPWQLWHGRIPLVR
jgi:hypothetical protein